MVLAGGEFAYGSVSMPIHALPSSSPKTKRRAVAGAMVIALVALCAVICTVFVSRMDSDHSLQQHGAFNPMIGDLASAKAKLASPDAVPLPSGPLLNSIFHPKASTRNNCSQSTRALPSRRTEFLAFTPGWYKLPCHTALQPKLRRRCHLSKQLQLPQP
jgi:hypothetical protein